MACITKFCPLCRIRSAVAHLSFWAELAAEAPAVDQRLAGVGPRYVLCRVEEKLEAKEAARDAAASSAQKLLAAWQRENVPQG